MYEIKNYSFKKAEELSLNIKPSTRKNKKIDVYKDDDYLFSIGSIKNFDYRTYVLEKGKAYADERNRLYHVRPKKDLKHFKSFVPMYIFG